METPDWIDPLIETSYQLFKNHDPKSHLPFNAWGLHPHYAELWLGKIFEMVKKFKEKGYDIKDHLESFPNLSSTRFIALINTIQHKTSGMDDPELIRSIQDFFVESIKARAKEDIFAKEKNIELGKDDLDSLLNKRPLRKATFEESREIGKILVALASLTHGLYNDWCTDYDYEISGPYKKDEKTILIRSFPDTCPKDIWPEISWEYKDFSIITEYADLEASMVLVGCHIVYSKSPVEQLARYNFQVNGKEIGGLENLKKLRDELLHIAAKQYEKYMALDFEAQKIKYVYQEHYQLKKLFDLVGMDWKPSEEILQRIKGKELLDVFSSYDMTLVEFKEKFGFDKLIEAYQR